MTRRATFPPHLYPTGAATVDILMLVLQERLLHIPFWSWHGGAGSDEVICISELKMSIMAQNCLAPGIVTLLSNLIKPHRFKVRSFS